MKERHLVPPQSHCFGDRRQLRCFQPEKYNLRALASGWEQRAGLPWQCLASLNSSTSLSSVTSTRRHRTRCQQPPPLASSPGPDTRPQALSCNTTANHAGFRSAPGTTERDRERQGGHSLGDSTPPPQEEPAGGRDAEGASAFPRSYRTPASPLLYKLPWAPLQPVHRAREDWQGERGPAGAPLRALPSFPRGAGLPRGSCAPTPALSLRAGPPHLPGARRSGLELGGGKARGRAPAAPCCSENQKQPLCP